MKIIVTAILLLLGLIGTAGAEENSKGVLGATHTERLEFFESTRCESGLWILDGNGQPLMTCADGKWVRSKPDCEDTLEAAMRAVEPYINPQPDTGSFDGCNHCGPAGCETNRSIKRRAKKPWAKPHMQTLILPDPNFYSTPNGIICHPVQARQLREELRQREEA